MNSSASSLHAALDACVPAEAAGLAVALSGGPDSAALLAAAARLEPRFRELPLRAIHIDHQLQAAAADFRRVCESLCSRFAVPLTTVAIDVAVESGTSIEAAARHARYAAFAALLRPRECLLTAHHRKDQAETVLLQALRGAGLKGMSAMPTCRVLGAGWHVRPLLELQQSELRQLSAELKLGAADPMNEDLRFDRVYLRKAVWPLLEKRWPGAEIALARTAGHLADAQQLLDLGARADVARLRDGEALSVRGLRALSALKRINAVRLWLSDAGVEVPSTARLLEALRQVLDAGPDQQPSVAWGVKALRRYRDRLFVTEAEPPQLADARSWPVAPGSSIELGPRLGKLTWLAQLGGLAREKLPAAVVVRRREGGETLKPARLAKTQTVQHLCQSFGLLPWMRDALPLVFAGDELIAVADLWMDARWCAAAHAPGLRVAWNNGPAVS